MENRIALVAKAPNPGSAADDAAFRNRFWELFGRAPIIHEVRAGEVALELGALPPLVPEQLSEIFGIPVRPAILGEVRMFLLIGLEEGYDIFLQINTGKLIPFAESDLLWLFPANELSAEKTGPLSQLIAMSNALQEALDRVYDLDRELRNERERSARLAKERNRSRKAIRRVKSALALFETSAS